MRILGFESSAKSASVAICDENGLISQYFQNSGLTHSRTLLPMAEDMLKNLDMSLSDIDLIAVAHGPGSFTGVRIGVSAVKGLAWGSGKPVCGVSTLLAMAYNGVSAPEGSIICCVMDARREQFYNALFVMRGGIPVRLCEDRAIGTAKLVEDIENQKKPVFIVGDGARLCYNTLNNFEVRTILAPEPMLYQSAWGVCMAAQREPAQSVHELLPVYLRLSQAERERQERIFGR
ncbi:MAG: tRNA (adenosine(37)-N6)-threonylcarbamoyltransferase complex dimerization subunit type 1 TsaB [Clostridiales bacterium]|jgi:tRNA threonylcarbamoyladenosine biosynthesis protein TsaB|nr:tRNA (adenosine(37)-N6)-threonylcarbamoyltransferase complex dimerization subunit type 1 TsaB [Clostridiales bacterium]